MEKESLIDDAIREIENARSAAEVFDNEKFINEYTYSGNDLGAFVRGDETFFKLWAPTAFRVSVNLFDNGTDGEPFLSRDMKRERHGVWSISLSSGHGTYYTYTVTTALGTAETVDPYARSAGVNGRRGMVVDLSLTNPDGFEEDNYINTVSSYSDAVVWETHVRDFSVANDRSRYKGKYLAFTERGQRNSSGFSIGVDYLVSLGITHVQLLPIFDYASVDEENPDSGYNWGYDPENWNVPEGSYSTDPCHGEVRIREVKEMVMALHSAGIGVVMDVVYNHTYSSSSPLEKTVPFYYYRYRENGEYSNGSGCGNETASERIMFRRYMISSLLYWMTQYHLDGFRFDLMGVHDTATMQEIEKALHAVNPHCLIYGEGWSGGECAYPANLLATKGNISQVKATEGAAGSIAVFNDVIRDALKGSVFVSSGRGFISGDVTRENAERVAFGIRGGSFSPFVDWSVSDAMVVNYLSAHDNNTLWDKLLLSVPEASEEERMRMNRFAASVIMLSRALVFMLSGEEIMRTKGGDSNSYHSGDGVNRIDWASLSPGSNEEKMFLFYRSLIAMRKRYSWLRRSEVNTIVWDNNSIFVTYSLNGTIAGVAIVNPTEESFLGTLPPGKWKLLLDGDRFVWGSEEAEKCVSVPVCGVVLLSR